MKIGDLVLSNGTMRRALVRMLSEATTRVLDLIANSRASKTVAEVNR